MPLRRRLREVLEHRRDEMAFLMGSCLAVCQVQSRGGLVAQAIHGGSRPNQALRAVVASVHLSLEESLDLRKLRVVVEASARAMQGRAPANHQLDLVVRHNLDVAASLGPQTTAVREEGCSLLPWTFHACGCFARAYHLKSVRVAF